MKNKGISSILGALIFLQILLLSLVLIVSTQNNETSVALKAINRFHELSESPPITEFVDNNKTYIFSLYPLEITHIIYPNGQIKNVSILLTRLPVTSVLNGYRWAIIVTSDGAWYNISLLTHDSTYTTTLLFPNYHNWGSPLDPSILNPGNWGNYYIQTNDWNNWYDVFEGVSSPSGTSLAYVNYGGYQYALTDSVLIGYMPSTNGWINLTLIPKQAWDYAISDGSVYNFSSVLKFAIAIPVNATETVELATQKSVAYVNLTQLQYIFIPFTIYSNISSGYITYYIGPFPHTTYEIGSTIQYYFNGSGNSYTAGYNIPSSPVGNYTHGVAGYYHSSAPSNPVTFKLYYPTEQQFPYGFEIPKQLTAFTLYHFDINIPEGEFILYGYNAINDSWVKIFNLHYEYDNPNLYPASNGSALHYDSYWTLIYGKDPNFAYSYFEYLYNVPIIQYLTAYPFYILLPSGTYLAEVDLS